VTFTDAVSTCFNKYADFSGRASRPEYWYWVLFVFVVGVVFQVVGRAIGIVIILAFLFDLAVLIPGIAVGVRRLHDTGHSGWNLLWGLTIIGLLYVLYLYVQPTQPGANAYGSPPSARPL
jgi:uncharacterized membrane protein YhaH (DUF805 family)